MRNKIETTRSKRCSGFCLFLLHTSCFLLVVLYVNMFQFWAWLIRQLGTGPLTKILPVVATLVVLLLISLRFIRRVNRGKSIDMVFLALGIIGAFIALAIPDPNIPIKKIHVAEYIILSFLVRYTLSHRLEGASLTIFTALAVILLGVHDEMLQGFHSRRYYGWLDIVVNGVSGISGAFLGHALYCFETSGSGKGTGSAEQSISVALISAYIILYGTVIYLVTALYNPQDGTVSWFQLFPLSLSSFLLVLFYPKIVFDSRQHHGLQAIFWLASCLLVYPLLVLLSGMEFV